MTGRGSPSHSYWDNEAPCKAVKPITQFMFGPTLDSRTLLLSIAALGLVMAAISRSAAKAMPECQPALRAWSTAMLAAGVGFYLLHSRDYLPWFLTFPVANILVMLVAAYGLLAHTKLIDMRVPNKAIALSLGIGLSGVLASYLFGAPHALAVSAVSATLSALFGTTAILLVREALAKPRLLTAVTATVMGLVSVALLLRVFISGFGDPANVAPAATATPQISLLLLGIVYILTTSLWIFDTAHQRLRTTAIEASRRDGLTGIYTRTAFFELAENLVGERGGASYAVVMLDIDHFKNINDTFGHAAGDITLAHAARHIASSVRLSDMVGRYGGEEFCILLPNCSTEKAAELAERIVQDAAQQNVRLKDGTTIGYTLSAGYSAIDARLADDNSVNDLTALVEQADHALYRAKREGRNRAVAASGMGFGVIATPF